MFGSLSAGRLIFLCTTRYTRLEGISKYVKERSDDKIIPMSVEYEAEVRIEWRASQAKAAQCVDSSRVALNMCYVHNADPRSIKGLRPRGRRQAAEGVRCQECAAQDHQSRLLCTQRKCCVAWAMMMMSACAHTVTCTTTTTSCCTFSPVDLMKSVLGLFAYVRVRGTVIVYAHGAPHALTCSVVTYTQNRRALWHPRLQAPSTLTLRRASSVLMCMPTRPSKSVRRLCQ